MFKEGYRWQAPSSNNIARTWRGRKNYIGTKSSHRNKNLTAMKSINFRVSYQVEELIRWRFHMGGWEFYAEVSITTQALRTTLFWRRGACWVPIILVITPLLLQLYPLLILLCPYCPHIVIIVPHRIPLLLFLWLYIIIVMSAGLYCDSLDSYI